MHSHTQRIRRMETADALLGCLDFACTKHIMSLLDDPVDVLRAAAVSHNLRQYVIENSLCKRLYLKRFPRVTHVAYEANGRYHIIKLSNVLSGVAADWGTLEREHTIYSYLLQPRSKRMDCPRDCLLFPVGASSMCSKAENMLTSVSPVCTYPVGFSFLSSEGQSENRIDFLKCLESDICVSIMSFLDDAADIVRLSAVSRFWRQFTIANELAKQLCLKAIPQLSTVAGVVIRNARTRSSAETGTSTALKTEFSERECMVYVSLLRAIKKPTASRSCIEYAICASSTDNYPSESILHTVFQTPRYWSSKGQSNPDVPETLTYKIRSGLWLITAIDIQPLAAGSTVYSAKYVRFRMGHPKSATVISTDPLSFPLANPVDDNFEWTYTSPEFPVEQDFELRPFELPKPALCKDGYLQVELMGRVGRKETDGLFYICMTRVRVLGRPLSPAFDTEIHTPSGGMLLRYYPASLSSIMRNPVMREDNVVVVLPDPHLHGAFEFEIQRRW